MRPSFQPQTYLFLTCWNTFRSGIAMRTSRQTEHGHKFRDQRSGPKEQGQAAWTQSRKCFWETLMTHRAEGGHTCSPSEFPASPRLSLFSRLGCSRLALHRWLYNPGPPSSCQPCGCLTPLPLHSLLSSSPLTPCSLVCCLAVSDGSNCSRDVWCGENDNQNQL